MYNQIRIVLYLFAILIFVACKDINQQKLPVDAGTRKLQVELRMPEAWKRIVIGPKNAKAYPKVPYTFSMFMTGESTGTLKPYLIISSEISQLNQQRTIENTQEESFINISIPVLHGLNRL